ncbi:MAG: hypothetical protein JNM36_00485 [Chitinophagales bacterium]|nr:hypothetical protein [Chitinophagales bacterium]
MHISSSNNKTREANKVATMNIVDFDNEIYFKIANHDAMRPFLMSIVSQSNHWMFISSNGGLTAGRKNAENALFPYYTDDKLTEMADFTGSKSIFQIHFNDEIFIWEPFSERFSDRYPISRNIYKNAVGNKVVFEEINHHFGVVFRYQWNTSEQFGFVKKSTLHNFSANHYPISVLDGIQNIMPSGVGSYLQNNTSNLVDAYKRNELHPQSGLGMFSLSAIIVDKAEPSEALKANIAWSLGVEKPKYLLSSLQLNRFRQKQAISEEYDIKGEKGAYFIVTDLELHPNTDKHWTIVANVNQNHAQIVSLYHSLLTDKVALNQQIEEDIKAGTKKLIELVASADGLQFTADQQYNARHFSNVLYNILRGGIFDNNYQIEKSDFVRYLSNANKNVYATNKTFIDGLASVFSKQTLKLWVDKCKDANLGRLAEEYMPLKLSRRHGDPSRPWNQFSINIYNETDGSKILDYEGNWRDIFQNWEALVHAYPDFIKGMIFKFLNASTFDGYNPYRVTKGGFDWETIEPDNPWSYIGYWGDHQIIYLLKFLEFFDNYQPNETATLLLEECFVYANVPYRIKSYGDILKNPKNTIDFDEKLDHAIRKKIIAEGADGALLRNQAGEIYQVNFLEKLLAMVLAKLANFIPEAGIWMNTQRPEWNDANNALVGNGASMVTLYYLQRFFNFFRKALSQSSIEQVTISSELKAFFTEIAATLDANQPLLVGKISDSDRKKITDALGEAASNYRNAIYTHGFSGTKAPLALSQVLHLVNTSLKHFEHSILANQRTDQLYHAYNVITIAENEISISHLSEMLEGQVAVLSSGFLSSNETLALLEVLQKSALYRADQNSYLLYPNKDLPRFLDKNTIPKVAVEQSQLLQKLLSDNNLQIINRDIEGTFHFNGNFKNANDLKAALDGLASTAYQPLVEVETATVLAIFEAVFNHKAFTGRSGTFFAYEGLGSIYWHMVSKLHLAVQEACLKAIENQENPAIIDGLTAHYCEIGKGIGIHKSPAVYGAFPTDPYSHTPMHRGAQQPGMTGQVKEDILIRFAELGVFIKNGALHFNPCLLEKSLFWEQEKTIEYVTVQNEHQQIQLPPNSLCFTICQIPIIYKISPTEKVEVGLSNSKTIAFNTLSIDLATSQHLFNRSGAIVQITVSVSETSLK